ncbi:ethanolamine utilization protein EutQ [Desulfacinum infernum DSM 9756]|uniref:Ethanolamine utilization protein EutQ n=1 Tax=Desulfacinum infernum DSM 9756 TaxID=1121391 RepID=A0A1M5IC99_9BACT|nr:cupin domain-containing protein [Desulfacinum infernum]SHG25530.1 ethanolamine utilization protein EutQ [Desulfacinum infernum DSM 9756]
MGKELVTVSDVQAAADAGKDHIVAPRDRFIVTPAALDLAERLEIRILEDGSPAPLPAACPLAKDENAPETEAPADDRLVVEEVIRRVCERLEGHVDPERLKDVVARLVSCRLEGGAPAPSEEQDAGLGGVIFVDASHALAHEGDAPPIGEKVLVTGVLGGDDQKLAGAYMAWEQASFRRTVESPEIQVVLEGELHLTVGGRTLKAKPGDMLYLPEGVKVLYSTPSRVRLACINAL